MDEETAGQPGFPTLEDRSVQFPGRFRLAPVEGAEDVFDLVAQPGEVAEEGTRIDSAWSEELRDYVDSRDSSKAEHAYVQQEAERLDGRIDAAEAGLADLDDRTGESLAAKADAVHTHDASAIAGGVLPVARGGTGASTKGAAQRALIDGETIWPDVVELGRGRADGGFVDFHFPKGGSEDYTSRIIEDASGQLNVNGVKVRRSAPFTGNGGLIQQMFDNSLASGTLSFPVFTTNWADGGYMSNSQLAAYLGTEDSGWQSPSAGDWSVVFRKKGPLVYLRVWSPFSTTTAWRACPYVLPRAYQPRSVIWGPADMEDEGGNNVAKYHIGGSDTNNSYSGKIQVRHPGGGNHQARFSIVYSTA